MRTKPAEKLAKPALHRRTITSVAIASLDGFGRYAAAYRLESHGSTPARARDGRASVGVSMEQGQMYLSLPWLTLCDGHTRSRVSLQIMRR